MLVWKGHKAKVQSLAFSPGGRLIATTAGDSKYVCLWDATSGELVRRFWQGYDPTRVAAFLPDGRHIVALYQSNGGCVWEVETGKCVTVLDSAGWQYSDALAVSPVDGRVVTHVMSGFAEWDAPTRPGDRLRRRDRLWSTDALIYLNPLRLTYSPAGTYFCVLDQTLTLYDPMTRRKVHTFADREGAAVVAAAFTPDESRVVAAFGHRAAVWHTDRPNEKPVELRGHEHLVRAVGFLPGGELVMTAGMDGTVRVWDADAGAERCAFDWGIGKVRVAAVSPDGTLCAAGGDTGQLVVWDVDV